MGNTNNKTRCPWVTEDPLYIHYHDTEWGVPVYDDQKLFEKLCLEGFQAGLSWLTVLKKRENFRRAFAEFDIKTVAQFTADDIDKLMQNSGIIRHREKIKSCINNAQKTLEIIDEYSSFSDFIWSYVPCFSTRPTKFDWDTLKTVTQSPESVRLAKDLKSRGFNFVGPTTMHALMQSIGMVNDHTDTCWRRAQIS